MGECLPSLDLGITVHSIGHMDTSEEDVMSIDHRPHEEVEEEWGVQAEEGVLKVVDAPVAEDLVAEDLVAEDLVAEEEDS